MYITYRMIHINLHLSMMYVIREMISNEFNHFIYESTNCACSIQNSICYNYEILHSIPTDLEISSASHLESPWPVVIGVIIGFTTLFTATVILIILLSICTVVVKRRKSESMPNDKAKGVCCTCVACTYSLYMHMAREIVCMCMLDISITRKMCET